ncbi:MAG: hypothetical protein ABI653_02695 [Bacteroidota bacterium]
MIERLPNGNVVKSSANVLNLSNKSMDIKKIEENLMLEEIVVLEV